MNCPAESTVSGDPNQDGNTDNDRLAGCGRNAFLGPDYATMDMRMGRGIKLGGHLRLELTGEAFNLFNRDNKRYDISDSGFYVFPQGSSASCATFFTLGNRPCSANN